MREPIKIIQISDLHLFATTDKELLGVNTQESFQAVVNFMRERERDVDFIILSGDLSQDGSEASYQRLAMMLKPLNLPVYFLPGNHDDITAMDKVFPLAPIKADKQIIRGQWQIILLNSQKPGAVEGLLDSSQLIFLKKCLTDYPQHNALIVFHHQPVSVGCEWLDKLGLTNADELWQLVSHYKQVKTILFGHVHQEFQTIKQGISCYSPPSTCIQFKGDEADFHLAHLPQGYRRIELFVDGKIKTEVQRIEKYVGHFDPSAKGY